ncbi:MAG: CehA/McbA family metallohydrolase [Fervidobacterium nodosum]
MSFKRFSFTIFLAFFIITLLVTFGFAEELKIFYGNLHSHTSFSDGKGTPEEAYSYAEKYGDFLAVTDHCYFLKIPVDGQKKTVITQQAARNATEPGKFVGLQGFEWTAGSGHINVFETIDFISRDEKGDLKDFYEWIVKSKKLAQFNHPGMTFGNFQNFWFVPEADKYVNLVEIGNGNSTSNDTISEEMYSNFILALNRGWHVSPTANQDNHKQNWIGANDSRTGVLAKSLTYDDIMDALWNRRTFASEDKNVKLYVFGNNRIMGSILYDSTQITLAIKYEDKNDPVEQFSIVTQSKVFEVKEVVGKDSFEITKTFDVPDGYEWYFVYIRQKDGNEIVSAPIWVESSEPVKANYVRIGPEKPRYGQQVIVNFDLYNQSESDASGELNIYLNGNLISSEKVNLRPYEIIYDKSISLNNIPIGNNKIEFYFNNKNIQSSYFEVLENSGVTVLVDRLHENDISENLKKFLKDLENEGNQVTYSETVLAGYENVNAVLISTPKLDGLSFFKDLTPEEVEWLNEFKGDVYLIRGSDDEYFEMYKSLLKNAIVIESIDELYKIFNINKSSEAEKKILSKTVFIDQGHSNDYYKDKLTLLEKYLRSIDYKVEYINKIEKLDGSYLVIMNGKGYTDEEIKNIADFLKMGGTLIITSKSDYQNGGNTEDLNTILDYINSPVRFNDDQVIDEINNYGANYKVIANNVRFYSSCSLILYGKADILISSDTAKSIDSDGKNDAETVDKVILAASFNFVNGKVILLGKAIFSDYDFTLNEDFIKSCLFK